MDETALQGRSDYAETAVRPCNAVLLALFLLRHKPVIRSILPLPVFFNRGVGHRGVGIRQVQRRSFSASSRSCGVCVFSAFPVSLLIAVAITDFIGFYLQQAPAFIGSRLTRHFMQLC